MYCQQKRKAAPSDIMVAYTIFEVQSAENLQLVLLSFSA